MKNMGWDSLGSQKSFRDTLTATRHEANRSLLQALKELTFNFEEEYKKLLL